MLVHLLASGAINPTAITSASWFLPFVFGMLTGMFIRKFF